MDLAVNPVARPVEAAVAAACGRIAPLWPLERFVAVNPYLGLVDRPFAEVAALLDRVAGARSTLSVDFYLAAVDDGRITRADLEAALAASALPAPVASAEELVATARAMATDEPAAPAAGAVVPTVAAVATRATGHDWDRFCVDRVSSWAAAYYDDGQALWSSADPDLAPFAAWKEEAEIDRTPEVMGLRGFRRVVAGLPDDPMASIEEALERLAVPAEAHEIYLHTLLLRLGGWAGIAARVVWDHRLVDHDDDSLVQFVAVLTAWELGLLEALPAARPAWDEALAELTTVGLTEEVRPELAISLVLQEAFDRSEQRRLLAQLAANASTASDGAPDDASTTGSVPAAQAVFCIDVRSEVLRRHLEAAGDVDTIGFAGFFGVAVEYLPLAHTSGDAQCPVLLTPSSTVRETVGGPARTEDAVRARQLSRHVRRAWKSFKMGAISCFSFVGPVGLLYLPKLFTDSSGRTRPVPHPETDGLPEWARQGRGPSLDAEGPAPSTAGIPLDARVELAEGALRAMSLTSGFAPLVLVAGHGSSTVNNPYATGLDCGACGGHTGESNARIAVAILNDDEVRAVLRTRGIEIPGDTWFVAGLHDTTTDVVTLFDRASIPAARVAELAVLDTQLAAAGAATRAERARRMGISATDPDLDDAVVARSTDWAQVRPEWGLAGCRTFVVAPRSRTRDLDLEGRSFLHSYDWHRDQGFGVLELIMTAPMVVASWISLQYYASTVDNERFGSGNKTLHNVVGRLGVLEGNGGDLRPGLPWQSVHDGERYQHEPLHLNVVIEAPIEAMTDVLARHDGVRDLVDNGWLNLFAMDATGAATHRYAGDLRWETV